MRIGLDLDGTLIDSYRFVDEHGRRFLKEKGIQPAVDMLGIGFDEHFLLADYFRSCGMAGPAARQESGRLAKEFWDGAYPSYISAPFIDGMAAAVRSLCAAGPRVYVISSRRGAAEPGDRGEMVRHSIRWQFLLNRVPYHHLVNVENDEKKLEAVRLLQLDAFIEDKPRLIQRLPEFTFCISLERPYNRPIMEKERCAVCRSAAALWPLLQRITRIPA